MAWALLLSFAGIVREDFPASDGLEKAVGVITVLLVGFAITGAIVDAVGEEHGNGEEGEGEAEHSLVLPV